MYNQYLSIPLLFISLKSIKKQIYNNQLLKNLLIKSTSFVITEILKNVQKFVHLTFGCIC